MLGMNMIISYMYHYLFRFGIYLGCKVYFIKEGYQVGKTFKTCYLRSKDRDLVQ